MIHQENLFFLNLMNSKRILQDAANDIHHDFLLVQVKKTLSILRKVSETVIFFSET